MPVIYDTSKMRLNNLTILVHISSPITFSARTGSYISSAGSASAVGSQRLRHALHEQE